LYSMDQYCSKDSRSRSPKNKRGFAAHVAPLRSAPSLSLEFLPEGISNKNKNSENEERAVDTHILTWERGESLDGPERWYPVPGYESLYFASTLGRIIRITGGQGTRAGRYLTPSRNHNGYMTVRLTKGGISKTFNLHWLIARTFLGEPPVDVAGNAQIHHNDADTRNNAAVNLSYTSQYENLMEQQARYQKTGHWPGR